MATAKPTDVSCTDACRLPECSETTASGYGVSLLSQQICELYAGLPEMPSFSNKEMRLLCHPDEQSRCAMQSMRGYEVNSFITGKSADFIIYDDIETPNGEEKMYAGMTMTMLKSKLETARTEETEHTDNQSYYISRAETSKNCAQAQAEQISKILEAIKSLKKKQADEETGGDKLLVEGMVIQLNPRDHWDMRGELVLVMRVDSSNYRLFSIDNNGLTCNRWDTHALPVGTRAKDVKKFKCVVDDSNYQMTNTKLNEVRAKAKNCC